MKCWIYTMNHSVPKTWQLVPKSSYICLAKDRLYVEPWASFAYENDGGL